VPATAAPIAPQPIESAVSARTFVESIGVNVHLHATDTAYGNYPAVKSLLTGANLHHVRDGLIDTTWQAYYDRLNDLGSAGIHSTLITNVAQSTTLVSAYPSRVQRSLEAIEGPNETTAATIHNGPRRFGISFANCIRRFAAHPQQRPYRLSDRR